MLCFKFVCSRILLTKILLMKKEFKVSCYLNLMFNIMTNIYHDTDVLSILVTNYEK